MASVLLCEDERLGRQVAVKRLHADSPVDVERRFKREAKLGASLNHPNVVSVFDTATDDEGVLIVMEYVDGHPLSQLVRHGPLRPEEVCRIVSDIGDALDHAHAQGVVHRDVKPGNVLIRDDGVTKLADLGIATAADDTRITRSGIVLGTAAYMAPEQLDGRGATAASDIYALAAVAFEALGGRKPREGKTPMQIAHSLATQGPPDLREAWARAPAAAAQVLKRGMALEPEDRQASAGELARELTEALRDEPRTAPTRRFTRRSPVIPPPPPPTRGGSDRRTKPPSTAAPLRSRQRGRRPGGAIALALVFIALAIAAVAGAVLSGGDDNGSSPAADSTPRTPAKKGNAKKKQEPKKAAEGRAAGRARSHSRARSRSRAGGTAAARRRRDERRRAELTGLRPHEPGPLRRGDPDPAARRRVVPGRHHGPQLRVRALQPREVAAARRAPGRGDPDPRAAAQDPQPDRDGPAGARAR